MTAIREPSYFQKMYAKVIKQSLMNEFNYSNIHQVPVIKKIVINIGLGKEVVNNPKVIQSAYNDLAIISGQKPYITKAKKSIAAFKVRKGMSLGCCVDLRSKKMYYFLERLVYLVLPRVRDFRGFNSKGFDRRGNFNFGLDEQLIFPEIMYDDVTDVRGLNVTIVTSANTDKEAKKLLEGFSIPFSKII